MALIPAVPLRAIFDFAYAGYETVDVSTVTADRVKQFLDTGEKILLIDLLPTKEFAQKRIPGARSIPMAISIIALPKLPNPAGYLLMPQTHRMKSRPGILIYGRNGYRNVAMMVEGFQGW